MYTRKKLLYLYVKYYVRRQLEQFKALHLRALVGLVFLLIDAVEFIKYLKYRHLKHAHIMT